MLHQVSVTHLGSSQTEELTDGANRSDRYIGYGRDAGNVVFYEEFRELRRQAECRPHALQAVYPADCIAFEKSAVDILARLAAFSMSISPS